MKTTVTTLALLLLAATGLATTTSPTHASSGDLVVIGDSISDPDYGYSDKPKDIMRAWWSYLGAKSGTTPVLYAERGSGYHKAAKCTGTTFYQRLRDNDALRAAVKRATYVVIEGGVNDSKVCKDGRGVTASQAAVNKSIRLTIREVKRIRGSEHVYVTAPWGPASKIQAHKKATVAEIKAAAKKYKFRYVDTASGQLTRANTKDGVHPIREGSKAIYRAIWKEVRR